jgi:radical SAM superfamily enzyme YgiQ (UPF0313 family)
MARILLVHPNRWGRGITAIWIPSHTAVLKEQGHDVRLFDATFYTDWSVDEVGYNTANQQYRPSDYERRIELKQGGVRQALQETIDTFRPDLVFHSAISSHIHGEGEYVSIQYGTELLNSVSTDATVAAGGLQVTAQPESMFERFPGVDYFIAGESEFVLAELAANLDDAEAIRRIPGLVHRSGDRVRVNPAQELIRPLDRIPPYDYSILEDQVFLRPYNGEVVRAVDYELSRGCPFTCSYCVETVIQRYYGFEEQVGSGVLRNASTYLRSKSAERIFAEMRHLHEKFGIELFRCQDTNFLSIDRKTLEELATRIERGGLDVRLYIETRPETISEATIPLLQRLGVDGVGMGIELASERFRKSSLNRFPSQDKIVRAFAKLREVGIRRTAYNIIGLPEEDEAMILDTIELNRELEPDNVTVAFYSPYIGTPEQRKSKELRYFDDYEYHVDGQLRTVSRDTRVPAALLQFYKKHFVTLVREGLAGLDALKQSEKLALDE